MLSTYSARRQKLLAQLPEQSLILLRAGLVKLRNADTAYPYRAQSDFYYLTGCEEPEAAAILVSSEQGGEFIFFLRERDPRQEQWEGPRLGLTGAIENLGATQAYSIKQFDEILLNLCADKQRIYCFFDDETLMHNLQRLFVDLKKNLRAGINGPAELYDLSFHVHEMRLLKDEDEINLMRKAARISAEAHVKAMQGCKAGMREYELQATIECEFKRKGCKAVAYPSIVASGSNSCVLHYTNNDAELKDGDLVLVDAGGEYRNYASDITRTYPVNGKFSPEQKAIYELVLRTQEKVIASIAPGVSRDLMQKISEKEITQGLIELGLLKGSLEKLLAERSFQRFYMHRIGHWLGLDVHDVGSYKLKGEWRFLEEGMTLTVEPGVYIAPNQNDIEPRWWGIGVRIEDDILVTKSGYEVLSAYAPKAVADIESLMMMREFG